MKALVYKRVARVAKKTRGNPRRCGEVAVGVSVKQITRYAGAASVGLVVVAVWLAGTAQTQTITLKSNGYMEADFTVQ